MRPNNAALVDNIMIIYSPRSFFDSVVGIFCAEITRAMLIPLFIVPITITGFWNHMTEVYINDNPGSTAVTHNT